MNTSDALSTVAVILSALSCCWTSVLTIVGLVFSFVGLQELLVPNLKMSLVDSIYSLKGKPPTFRLEVQNLGQRPVHDLRLQLIPFGTEDRIASRSVGTLALGQPCTWDIGLDIFEYLKSSKVLLFTDEGLSAENPQSLAFRATLLSNVTVGFISKSTVKNYRLDMNWQKEPVDNWTANLSAA